MASKMLVFMVVLVLHGLNDCHPKGIKINYSKTVAISSDNKVDILKLTEYITPTNESIANNGSTIIGDGRTFGSFFNLFNFFGSPSTPTPCTPCITYSWFQYPPCCKELPVPPTNVYPPSGGCCAPIPRPPPPPPPRRLCCITCYAQMGLSPCSSGMGMGPGMAESARLRNNSEVGTCSQNTRHLYGEFQILCGLRSEILRSTIPSHLIIPNREHCQNEIRTSEGSSPNKQDTRIDDTSINDVTLMCKENVKYALNNHNQNNARMNCSEEEEDDENLHNNG
ncbi:hypothetical protein ACFFRR_002747 [Megaselia abdita]